MVTWIRLRQNARQTDTTQFVRLDGERVGIRAQYSALLDRWSISILDSSRRTLVGTLRLVPGVDLLRPYKHIPGVPPGQLFVHGTSREPPTKDTADDGVRLLYRGAA